MPSSHRIESDIVLLGAGHAHLEVLRRFALRPEAGVRLTLIGREPETPYSGMMPGLIRGDYTFRQAHVDLAPIDGKRRPARRNPRRFAVSRCEESRPDSDHSERLH